MLTSAKGIRFVGEPMKSAQTKTKDSYILYAVAQPKSCTCVCVYVCDYEIEIFDLDCGRLCAFFFFCFATARLARANSDDGR